MEQGYTRGEKALAAAGVIAALGAIAMPVLNPDLYWHLSAGRYIVENLKLPAADFLSWTEQGAPWTDFEWLVQLLYYGAHSLAGAAGFFALKTAVLGASFYFFFRTLADKGLARSAFFALPLWGLALMANSDLRPENFSVLFFAVLLWRLEAARAAGLPWPAAPAGFAGLALLFAVWANLHAGFAYGLLLLAGYAAGNRADAALFPSAGRGGLRLPLLGLAAAAAGTLLNPWGPALYSILLQHAAEAGDMARYLAEWAPPSLANPFHWPYMTALLGSFGLLLLRFLRERRLPLAHLLTLGWLAFESARHTRHIVFFSMAALVVGLDAAAGLWGPEKIRRAGKYLLGAAVLYLALFVWPRFLSLKVNLGAEAAGAAAYLKSAEAELGGRRLYNPWTWGGYLGWALNPDYKVFTDGRYIFHKHLAPVSAAMTDQDTWAEFAADRGLELVLFRRDYQLLSFGTPAGPVARPSYLLFMPEKDWALIYWDAFSVLFARRNKPLPAEFSLLRPDDLAYARLDICAGRASAEKAAAELEMYRARTAGAASRGEAARFGEWLGAYPGSCRR